MELCGGRQRTLLLQRRIISAASYRQVPQAIGLRVHPGRLSLLGKMDDATGRFSTSAGLVLATARLFLQVGLAGDDSYSSALGYGLASFSHVVENELPGALSPFDTCGTIMDLVAFVLCGHTTHEQATIDLTNAFSWGGFDLSTQSWPTSVYISTNRRCTQLW
ncbi:unnamed protein product [Aphanomyces euteiches]